MTAPPTILEAIASCFDGLEPIPLHLAVQMTPDALEHAWGRASNKTVKTLCATTIAFQWNLIGTASIRNAIIFHTRPRHFAEAVLTLMAKNVGTLKDDLDARVWERLRTGLKTTKAVLAGEMEPRSIESFVSDLRELNREPWNSSWIIFALGDAVGGIQDGYDTDHGVTMLMRALRVGIQSRLRPGQDFAAEAFVAEIEQNFQTFLASIGPPTPAEIIGAAVRLTQEPP